MSKRSKHNIIATVLLLIAAGVWIPVRLAHPDLTDMRLVLTFWPLLLFSMACCAAAIVILDKIR